MEDIRRTREDHYFLKLEQERLEELRKNAMRDEETRRLMEAAGIRDPELVRQLADAGFDAETFRVLYLVPLVQIAWSDGAVSQRESEQVLNVASLHGIGVGSAAYERLAAWLAERPSDEFFHTCLRGIKAMLRHRPAAEAQALSQDLVWYCTRIASASGGFLGLGPRVSREEETLLTRLAAELDARHHPAVDQVTRELST
jgi:hypothetical protein